MGTGKSNLRKHLLKKHAAIYDRTIIEKNWRYRLSTHQGSNEATVGELRRLNLPHYSLQSFTEYLVRFIIANDQVSSNPIVSDSCSHISLVNSCGRMSRIPGPLYASLRQPTRL